MPFLLFYDNNPRAGGNGSDSDNDSIEKKAIEYSKPLKTSLSETLTCYYPFAGRFNGGHLSHVVDCNDEGVPYFEARVNRSLADLLQQPKSEELKHFVPTHKTEGSTSPPPPPPPLLLIQATFFECGGMALGITFSHRIADAATIFAFTKAWASAALGHADAVVPDFSAAFLFRARDPFPINHSNFKKMTSKENNPCIANRYVFVPSKIAALKAKGASNSVQRPTRVEVISALLWKCTVEVSRLSSGEGGGSRRPSVVTFPVNIRSRLVPPLSEHSFGNLAMPTVVQADGSETNLSAYVCHLRKHFAGFGDKHADMLQAAGDHETSESAFLDLLVEAANTRHKNQAADANLYASSSCCKLRLYEVDFGWGKPTWVKLGDVCLVPNTVILVDTYDGEGVEAWVSFTDAQEKDSFEAGPELLAYASINPTPLQQHQIKKDYHSRLSLKSQDLSKNLEPRFSF